jgi:hypothetical protein
MWAVGQKQQCHYVFMLKPMVYILDTLNLKSK